VLQREEGDGMTAEPHLTGSPEWVAMMSVVAELIPVACEKVQRIRGHEDPSGRNVQVAAMVALFMAASKQAADAGLSSQYMALCADAIGTAMLSDWNKKQAAEEAKGATKQ
jgi:hypothetical protein